MYDREIHFYPSDKYMSYDIFSQCHITWEDTMEAILNYERMIHTTIMGLMNTRLLADGWRIFVHNGPHSMYEIKLGCDNERTSREIKIGHDLFKLWQNGEFGLLEVKK